METVVVKPEASKVQPKQLGTRLRGRSSSKKLDSSFSSAASSKKDDSKANKSQKGSACLTNPGTLSTGIASSSHHHHHTNPGTGPSLSDLDTNSNESNLPDVSEAIRLLDLDSQGPDHSETSAPMSAFHQPGGAPSVAGLRLVGLGGSSGIHHTWPSVGYCSSLLQKFVAKSQSGEPPPPAPPISAVLQLPTKGARKCFPVNDDLPPVPVEKSLKRSGGDAVRSAFLVAGGGGHADHELDMMVPLRGLDIHPSHVSPDSGIQSVSGSPFSVHSSPVHPSGGGGTTCSSSQQQPINSSSPCPLVAPTPSPPPKFKKASRKSGSGRKSTAPTSISHKSPPPPVVATVALKSSGRRNSNGTRRPRLCRDTASALSSGLNKDSSICQAIQRGIDAARRLRSGNASDEDDTVVTTAVPLQVPTSKIFSTATAASKESEKKDVTGKKRGRQPKATIHSIPKDPSSFVKQPLSAVNKTTVVPVTTDRKPPANEKLLVDPSLRRKRKQKRKKHKNSQKDKPSAPATTTIDPTLLTSLDELCRRLHRCAISRSVVSSSRKRPCVFQCRKYSSLHSMSAIGGVNSGHSRSKRKKVEDEIVAAMSAVVATTTTQQPVVAGTAKRKNKPKKSASQPIQTSCSTVASSAIKTESTATAAVASSVSAGETSTNVELLLPLKKRHHHLAASDIPSSSIFDIKSSNSNIVHPTSEKPSQQDQHQQKSSRKRQISKEPESVANIDLNRVSVISNGEESVPPPAKKKRGRKKKITNAEIVLPVTAPVTAPAPPAEVQPSIPVIETAVNVDEADANIKKKARRRKTFNRTGFPSAKKKRKKNSTPLPPFLPAPLPAAASVVALNPISTSGTTTSGPKQAKRPKVVAKEEDSESVVTTEPTSSEAASGDELNPSSAAAAAVAALAESVKNQKPSKKRSRATNNLRKRYLPAGLLSNYFKEEIGESTASVDGLAATGEPVKEVARIERSKSLTYDPDEHEHGLLPAPYYCERFLRRTKRDFQLPYDLWWQHNEGKLPGRESSVPSWNYRKIRNNVYYDVKPPYTNDAEPCNCTLPPPDATSTCRI